MKTKLTKKIKLQVFNFLPYIYTVKENLNALFLANNSMSMSMSATRKCDKFGNRKCDKFGNRKCDKFGNRKCEGEGEGNEF